jgi:electron transport complex protein RnfC
MAASASWPGGLRIPSRKHAIAAGPLVVAPRPRRVLLALRQSMETGAELEPCVAVGARVQEGDCIARPRHAEGAALHTPIGGTVSAIGQRTLAQADGAGTCVVIEAGAASDLAPRPRVPLGDGFRSLAPEALLAQLRDSGLAGLGGAAFALDSKLAQARRSGCELLLLNGVECDPWTCCDDRLLRDRAAEVLDGALVLLHASGAARCVVAVGDDKPEACAALEAARVTLGDARIELRAVPALYPGGAEALLVTTVTGVALPAGKLPADVGVLCHNVASAAALARFVHAGEPLLRRIVTVTGSGVARPCNVEAWIGTPLSELLALAGLGAAPLERLIVGGAMSGLAVADPSVPLTKAGNCVIAASAADLGLPGAAAELPCIRCGDCARACPVDLQPQQLHQALRNGDEPALARLYLDDCIECGCCDYVCPSRIPLTARLRAGRALALRRRAAEAQATDWRERHAARLARDQRAATTQRAQFERARAEGDGGGAP